MTSGPLRRRTGWIGPTCDNEDHDDPDERVSGRTYGPGQEPVIPMSVLPVAIPFDDSAEARPALTVGLAGAFAGVLTLLVVLALLGGMLQLTG